MITENRYLHLIWLWENETNDEETQEWRNELTDEEQALVDRWDNGYSIGFNKWYKNIMED